MFSGGDEATHNTNKFPHSSTRSGLPFELHFNCRSRGANLQGRPSSLSQPQHNHHHHRLRQRHHQPCQEESESPCCATSTNTSITTTTTTSSLRSPALSGGVGGCHNQLPQGRQNGLTSPRGNDLNKYVTPAQVVEEAPRGCIASRERARMTSDSGRNETSIKFHWQKIRSAERNHANALLDQLFEKLGLCIPENLYQLNLSSTPISDDNNAATSIRSLNCNKSNLLNTNYAVTQTLPESTAYTKVCNMASDDRVLPHDIPAVQTRSKHRGSDRVSKHISREGQLTLLCQLRLYQLADRRPLLTVLMRILLGLLVVTSVQSSPTKESALFDESYIIQKPLVERDYPEYKITLIPDQTAKHNVPSLSSSEYVHHNQQMPDTSLFQFSNKTNSAPRELHEFNYSVSATNSTEYADNFPTLVHFKRKLNGNIEQTPKTNGHLKDNESDVTSNINGSTEAESNVRYARKVGTSWELHQQLKKEREHAARRWAPLVWLHPQELFFPGDVEEFLPHVNVSGAGWSRDDGSSHQHLLLPVGPDTEHLHLSVPIDTECCNCPVPAFLHGERPKDGHGPPVYAHVHACFEPDQKHAQVSQMSYLLEADDRKGGAGKSLRDQIQTLSHPLQRPPRYRRRHRVVTGWREKREAGEEAESVTHGQSYRGVYQEDKSLITEASKHTTATATTSRLLPITNSIEVNKTNASDLLETPTMQEVKEVDKSSQLFKWNKISLQKPHTKAIGSPNFKKIPSEKTEKKIIGEQFLVQEQALDTKIHNSDVPSNTKNHSSSVAHDQYLGHTTPQPNPTDKEQKPIVASDPTYPSETITGSWEAQLDKRHTDGDSSSSSFYTTPKLELQLPDGEDAGFFSLDTPTPFTSNPFQEEAGTRGHHFTVTYWFFYPYNRGKPVCTSNVWLLGRVAKPLFKGKCLGQNVVMGNHVGDWEHVSIYFEDGTPKHLYMSAHNFGAFYTYRAQSGRFQYVSQDVREGMPVRAEYPQYLNMEDGRIVLYVAKGSHGIWPVAGNHPYNSMVVPLHDETGRGVLWDTSRAVEVIDTAASSDKSDGPRDSRQWLGYRGHWGNPSSNCHPGLLGFCELRDGPQGILMKRMNFPCHVPRHYTFPKE